MGDPVIENAQHAAATPASGPPSPDAQNQWRLHEMTGGKYTPTLPKPKAPKPPEKSAAEQREAERVEKLPPAERRRQELTKELSGKLTDVERAAKSQELQQILAALTTEAEAQAWAEAPLAEKRKVFDLAPPEIPGVSAEDFDAQFGWAEEELITVSRNMGLTSKTVRGCATTQSSSGFRSTGSRCRMTRWTWCSGSTS